MNCSYATDDKLAGDLVAEGHIDHCVRKSIKLGMAPITALQIATINTARHYRLRNFGAIAPRYWADFIVFDDLKKFAGAADLQKGRAGGGEGKVSGHAAGDRAAAAQHDEPALQTGRTSK